MKRIFDLFSTAIALLLLSPLMLSIAIFVKIDSRGPVFFRQERIGKDMQPFRIWKFRTMKTSQEKGPQITIGKRDQRVTGAGYWLRKYKLDELPQLFNIFKGEMSVVGPRPEVPEYVALYDDRQKKVLSVRPGLTDYASLAFSNENELLQQYNNPEQAYREIIMPEKLEYNLRYLRDKSMLTDLRLILATIRKVISS